MGAGKLTHPLLGWCAAGALLAGWCLAGSLAYAHSLSIPWRTTLTPVGLCCALLTCLSAEPLVTAFGTAAWLLALLILARRDWTLAALALIWTAAFLAPYTFSPGNIYRYYLSQDGYILLIALAAGSWKAVGGQ